MEFMPPWPRRAAFAVVALAGLLLVLPPPGAAAADPAAGMSDADVLLALKASFANGDAALPSWQRGTDACAWQGVSCNRARIVTIL